MFSYIFFITLIIESNTNIIELNKNNTNSTELNENYTNSIELNENNTVSLVGDIDDDLISKTIQNLYSIESNDIYIYIDTNGGSVTAGNKLIDTIDYLKINKNISCIISWAASMGFVILQSCPNRYATRRSILMQHQMRITLNEQKNRIINYMNYIDHMEDDLIEFQSERIKLNKKKFKELTKDDWWLTSKKALEENVIDKIVTVGCHKSLMTTYTIVKHEILEKIKYTYSRCPIIKTPIETEYLKNS